MLKVHVQGHKDGDSILIVKQPWWLDAFEFIVTRRVCPCCGVSGFLSRNAHIELLFYRLSDVLYKFTSSFQKEIFQAAIPDFCEASIAIFGNKDYLCWRDDCKYHPKEEEGE